MPSDARMDRSRWTLLALIGAVALVAGVVGGVIASAIDGPGPAATTGALPAGGAKASSCNVTAVANEVLPSVVTIAVTGTPGPDGQAASGTGTGEVIRSGGYILTNNHVIAAAASGGTIKVFFDDGTESDATLVGRDPLTDLAVIKVTGHSSLPTVELGSMGTVKVGQPVVALGAPLGLSSTVTSGIVSALDRNIQVPGETGSRAALLAGAIQTDAAINPGNSGGVLSNCSGQMIGIPTAGATVPTTSGESSGGSIGLGFAIPVDLAKLVSDELISSGHATHATFGLSAEPVRPGSLNGSVEGLLIISVVPGGPAASAGLQEGDVITSIDGTRATDTTQLMAINLTKRPGDRVRLGYERNGHHATVTVTLGQQAQ